MSVVIPKGLCQCGCGQKTRVSASGSTEKGWIKGEPRRFLHTHHNRISLVDYVVDEATGCWVWQRSLNNKGYGTMTRKGKRVYAHVFYYVVAKGPVPEGLELHHKCENPPCVNPRHLEPVTHKANLRFSGHTKLDEKIVKVIKRLNVQGLGYRRLAKLFNVSRSAIQNVVVGKTWREVK
jgi:hypothetical protein